MEVILVIFGLIVFIGGIILYEGFVWGFVTYKFYYWFGLPIIPELPHFNYMECVSLFLVLSLFKNHHIDNIKKEYKDETNGIIQALLAPWISLFIGWLFTLFI